ncbi:MAG: dihydrolipoamide acetyltransferase family protein [Thermoplasmatota archaeon]
MDLVTEFKFPDVGEGITEGRIKTWFVNVGDRLKEDQAMAEVETDKAIVEMPSPVEGAVLKILVPAGEKVKVGQVMVVIGDEGESVSADTETEVPRTEEKEEPAEVKVEGTGQEKVFALPKVRKMARENNIDLTKVKGTGPKGRITEEDIDNFLESGKEAVSEPAAEAPKKPAMKVKLNYDFYGHISYAPYKGLREVIADKLTTSKFTAPHAAAMDEVDMTDLWNFRKGMNEELSERDIKLTFMPFIVMAVMKSLRKHPQLNSTLDEEAEEIIIKKYYNIGIAADTKDGLIVPVLKRCETKGLIDMQRDMDNLIKQARERTLDLADLRGGSFTISNFGALGGIYGVPIINYPEAAILGVGKIRDLPRVVDGQVVVRKTMGISVSFDHRIVDGAEVARFINTLKSYLENPGRLTAPQDTEEH